MFSKATMRLICTETSFIPTHVLQNDCRLSTLRPLVPSSPAPPPPLHCRRHPPRPLFISSAGTFPVISCIIYSSLSPPIGVVVVFFYVFLPLHRGTLKQNLLVSHHPLHHPIAFYLFCSHDVPNNFSFLFNQHQCSQQTSKLIVGIIIIIIKPKRPKKQKTQPSHQNPQHLVGAIHLLRARTYHLSSCCVCRGKADVDHWRPGDHGASLHHNAVVIGRARSRDHHDCPSRALMATTAASFSMSLCLSFCFGGVWI